MGDTGGVRCFVAVWPSAGAAAMLEALPRPQLPALRWTTPDQWHVTLHFLGNVDPRRRPDLERALERVGRGVRGPVAASLGPATTRLGRSVLCVPVVGLDAVAEAVGRELASGSGPGYRGHLTLARARRGRTVPAHLAGVVAEAGWAVHELALVVSTLDPAGARYRQVATVPLGATGNAPGP